MESGDVFPAEQVSQAANSTERPWILSIEDDEDVVLALRLRLQEMGIDVVNIAEGRSGYFKAFDSPPNAIILDYELPEGNGDYVLRRLKESPVTSSIPVIVLTGRREGYIQRQMQSLGADAFLTKPFKWELLRDTLSRVAELQTSSH